ncbi:mannose-1-phosphate guanylyltransferase/mannose-6-phosphate isomerase [Candidatus Thioglobus sp.]|nr:mannose-1-phosphate guanylyltransferase/mannose-6-phosphate isomerase [Candidatus Thioglobus sp.]
MIVPVILSGGSGTRLWPLSRTLYPKQFLDLVNETTLFQDTLLRLPKSLEKPLVICNEEQRFLAAEQLRQIQIDSNCIILEPEGKNTAPAIALAALKLKKRDDDPLLLVLSADHLIQDIAALHKTIKIAELLAINDKLVTFGVVPNKAEIGYGYIEIDNNESNDYFNIKSFREKPNRIDAQKYINSGNYLWNSGMFLFKSSLYLNELAKFEPDILQACEKSLQTEHKDLDFIRLNNNEFIKCPSKSIDYAVMEKTDKSVVVPLDAKWRDIGSWESLFNSKEKDRNGNVSEGDVILENVTNTFAYSSNRLVAVTGVSDLIVVDTQDALLVSNRNNAQNIKNIVSILKNNNRPETEDHRKVFRPWGYYDCIDSDSGFQVKRILVNPGAKLSLQKHQYRAEHWIVVKGIATITFKDKVFTLNENQSTYIPKEEIHRLENKERMPLEIIEIQTGEYLGEDDIIRLEDDYQRN